MTGLSDAALLEAFEGRTLPCEQFHHREHLRVAFALLARHGDLAEAALRFRQSLRAFAWRCGTPGLFHETLCWAWLALINQRMSEADDRDSERFLKRCPELLDSHAALTPYYDVDALLLDERARRTFLLPLRAGGAR